VQVTGDIRYRDVPDKNKFSHVCEALEYDVVSAGEDRNVMMTQEDLQGRGDRQQFATTDYDPFGG
jgi:hypothetical protein